MQKYEREEEKRRGTQQARAGRRDSRWWGAIRALRRETGGDGAGVGAFDRIRLSAVRDLLSPNERTNGETHESDSETRRDETESGEGERRVESRRVESRTAGSVEGRKLS